MPLIFHFRFDSTEPRTLVLVQQNKDPGSLSTIQIFRLPHASMASADAVLQDRELVALLLRGNVGPATFAALACVCRTWRMVCYEDEDVLRAVAAFNESLTKGIFMRLFCLSSDEANALPRTEHVRLRGGKFYLYGEAAVDQVLASGGMETRRKRMVRSIGSCEARYCGKPFLQEQEEEECRARPRATQAPRRQYYTPPRRPLDAYAVRVLKRLPYKIEGL